MTLTEFISILDTYTPSGYTLWAGGNAFTYNQEKDVQNTLLVVLPTVYPSFWRDWCQEDIKVELRFSKVVPIKNNAHQTQQHDPYSALEVRDEMYTLVKNYLSALDANAKIQVLTPSGLSFFDAPEGLGVNSQVWCNVTVTLRVFNVPGFVEPVYLTDDYGNSLTDDDGNLLTV